ncbi:hypothetical protein FRC12_016050 [Ceratobasidium sp. 428]|nr:hypothetical protein FRC12_016050 [Ceratobasidium sp. 428]
MDEEDELAKDGEEGGDDELGKENEPGKVDIGEEDHNDTANQSLLAKLFSLSFCWPIAYSLQIANLRTSLTRPTELNGSIWPLRGQALATCGDEATRLGWVGSPRQCPNVWQCLPYPNSLFARMTRQLALTENVLGLKIITSTGSRPPPNSIAPIRPPLLWTERLSPLHAGTLQPTPSSVLLPTPLPCATSNPVPHAPTIPVPHVLSNPVSRPSQPTATKWTHNQETAPFKKQAAVLLACIHALHKEDNKLAAGTRAGPALKKSSMSSKPKPAQVPRLPPSDVEMCDLLGNEPEPAALKVNRKDWWLAPQDNGAGNMGDSSEEFAQGEGVEQGEGIEQGAEQDPGVEQGAKQDEEVKQGNNNNPTTPKLTMRQRLQLATFTPEATELVQYCMDKIKLDMFTICPFPETLTPSPKNKKVYLDHWLVKYRTKGHEELRERHPNEGRPRCLPPIHNSLRKSCKALVLVYFDLQQGDNNAERARDLTNKGNEKWISLHKEDDNERFKHPIIQNTIINTFFRTYKCFGHTHIEGFTPLVPIPTITYMCSITCN